MTLAQPVYHPAVSEILRFLTRAGRLPAPLRSQLETEGVLHISERVRVVTKFSGSVPGLHSGWSASRHIGLAVFTRQRVIALIPSIPRLRGPAVDVGWDASEEGAAVVDISSVMDLRVDLAAVDPRFRGRLSVQFATALSDDVLSTLPRRSLAFDPTPEYVFHMLGVRVR